MAKIVRNIDNVDDIKGTDFMMEIEDVEFIDDKGRKKKFKIFGIVPVSTDECKNIDKDVDWDDSNFHFVIDVGGEIK